MSLSNHNSKNKNLINNYSSNPLSKNKHKKQLIKYKSRNNKSMAQLPIRPKLNLNGKTDYSLYKILNNETKNNNNISSINTTTAQNSIKTNKNTNSNNDLMKIYPQIKPIRDNKTRNNDLNINNTSISINLKKAIINTKEKPFKILDKNLYNNYKNKIGNKYIIESPEKKSSIDKNIKRNINKKIINTIEVTDSKRKNIFSSL